MEGLSAVKTKFEGGLTILHDAEEDAVMAEFCGDYNTREIIIIIINGVPVPTHLSGDSTLQRRLSYKHFHLRSVVVITDIIIFIVIIVVVVVGIIIIIIIIIK